MVAVMSQELYLKCLEILADWEDIDAIITFGGRGNMTLKSPKKSKLPEKFKAGLNAFNPQKGNVQGQDKSIELIKELIERTGKPIIELALFSSDLDRDSFENYQPVCFPIPERAVQVLRLMVEYRRFLNSTA